MSDINRALGDSGKIGPPLLTVKQAASHVGLQHVAVRRAIKRGDLPAVKLCGRIRVRPDDLRGWMASNVVERPNVIGKEP